MIQVIIVGAGGHGAEIDEYIQFNNTISSDEKIVVRGFIDDDPESCSNYKLSAPLLGSIKDHLPDNNYKYIIGIGNLTYRRVIVESLINKGAEFFTFIHNGAYVSPTSIIGNGVVIGPNVNLGPNVKIGDYTLINSRCSMGHDTRVGKYNFICPNVCFSGFTEVGDENLFGINSATIPHIKVGDRNKIAAGMVLDSNVGDDAVVFYRFKEKIIAVPRR